MNFAKIPRIRRFRFGCWILWPKYIIYIELGLYWTSYPFACSASNNLWTETIGSHLTYFFSSLISKISIRLIWTLYALSWKWNKNYLALGFFENKRIKGLVILKCFNCRIDKNGYSQVPNKRVGWLFWANVINE